MNCPNCLRAMVNRVWHYAYVDWVYGCLACNIFIDPPVHHDQLTLFDADSY